MKRLKTVLTALMITGSLALAGCGSSAEDLADEMCDCIKNQGPMACTTMASDHAKELGNDPDAMSTYSQKVTQCK